MQRFRYKARNNKGALFTGIVESVDTKHAVALLRERGLIVVNIDKESRLLNDLKALASGTSINDLANFTRQLATMLNSGLTLVDTLVILEKQNTRSLGSAISKMKSEIESGKSFSDALKTHPKIFDNVYVSLVQAGEAAGVLDKVLDKLAETLEKKREFESKIKGALLYPVLILFGMIVVMLVMMLYIIPQLAELYKDFDSELPAITQVLIKISDLFVNFWWIIAGIIGIIVISWKPIQKNSNIRRKLEQLLLSTPIFGPLWEQIMMATFSRTLALLIESGVPIVQSLKLCSHITPSILYETAIIKSSKLIEKGYSLAQACTLQSQFPPIMIQMMSVGEETGEVEKLLDKLSSYFQMESEQKVKNLTTAIEPLVLILLGIGIGFLVFAIVMPIYNLTTTL